MSWIAVSFPLPFFWYAVLWSSSPSRVKSQERWRHVKETEKIDVGRRGVLLIEWGKQLINILGYLDRALIKFCFKYVRRISNKYFTSKFLINVNQPPRGFIFGIKCIRCATKVIEKLKVRRVFSLTHSFPVHPSSTPRKQQKSLRFSVVFRGRERKHWEQMG